jgi:NTF2-like protein (DUF6841)
MKRVTPLLFVVLLSGSVILMGAAEAQDDRTKLSKTYFDEYAAALSSLDPQRILPYYHEPLMLITAPMTSILTTRADIEQWVKSRGEQMKGRGYARNAWDQLHVKQLNYGLAVASGLAVRYKGGRPRTGTARYHVRPSPDGRRLEDCRAHGARSGYRPAA